ncbi:MAG: hypothetical protein C5S49_01530 [Candidatus Methanogaster sp.]|nr:MAG: hypothetical protein C5S49_01530 [ANME-2 cluster archaeon]
MFGCFEGSWGMNASSEIVMSLDSNASVDGKAVTAECAETCRGFKTILKLLHSPR